MHPLFTLPTLRSRAAAALLALALTLPAAGTLRADDPPAWQDVTPAFPDGADTPYGGVDFGNGIFVAVGTTKAAAPTFLPHGVTFTSADGVTWRANPQTFYAFGRVRFANGRFYLAGLDLTNASHRIYSSTDGVNWTGANDPSQGTGIDDFAVNNGVIAATTQGSTLVSPDGANWQLVRLPDGRTAGFEGVAAGAGKFVFVGISAKLHTSPDGQTLTPQAGLDDYRGFTFLAYGNNLFLADGFAPAGVLSEGDTQLLSPDAGAWTKASPGLPQSNSPAYSKIYFARFLNGNFLALSYDGSRGVISASADAKNWTTLTILANDRGSGAFDLAYGAGRYVYMSSTHLYSGVAGTVTAPPNPTKRPDLSVTLTDLKIGLNASGSKVKAKGTLLVKNTGKRPAGDNVSVAAYLSDDASFSAANDKFLSLVNLLDFGVTTIAKKGDSGPLAVQFKAKPADLGPTTGKFLLIVVDPENKVDETDETNNVLAIGPLP